MDKDYEKKEYELSFLLKNKEAESAIESLLGQYGAEIFLKNPSVEIKLAYPVKKHLQAYFGYFQFRSLAETLEKITQSLKLNPSVLRILAVTPPAVKNGRVRKSREDSRTSRVKPIEAVLMPVSGGALSNEALEEKLEEILK